MVLAALLDASDNVGVAVLFAGIGAGLILGPLLAWRSYRRRSAGEFRVRDDRVEFVPAAGAAEVVIPAEELAELSMSLAEGPKASGWIELRGAGRKILLNEAWPLPEVAADLVRRLLPGLLQRAEARLERGETLEFRRPLRVLLGPAVGALACVGILVVGAIQTATRWGTKDAVQPRALIFVGLMVAGLVAALRLLRRRWRGGMLVSKSGLRRLGEDFGAETPWSSITRCGEAGGVLELSSDLPPETFRYPIEAPNAVLLRALAGRLRPS